MPLTHDEIKKIAHLARLAISNEEIDKYTLQLTNIINLAEEMSKVSTDAIEPLSHALDVHQPLRKDIANYENEREKFQQIAPQTEVGFYLVPKVIE